VGKDRSVLIQCFGIVRATACRRCEWLSSGRPLDEGARGQNAVIKVAIWVLASNGPTGTGILLVDCPPALA